MKYYYEFPLESETGKKMSEFHKACIEAENKAEEWAKKMGATSYYEDPNCFAGGISYLMFDKRPSKRRWKEASKINEEPVYVLNVPDSRENMSKQEQANAKLQDEQRQLPRVSVTSLYTLLRADIFGSDSEKKSDLAMLPATTPIFFAYGEKWYIGIDLPISQEGFSPITESAFNFRKNQLLEAAKNKA